MRRDGRLRIICIATWRMRSTFRTTTDVTLDALNDCMRDVVEGEYSWAGAHDRLVVVCTGYDRFTRCRRGRPKSCSTSWPTRPEVLHCSVIG